VAVRILGSLVDVRTVLIGAAVALVVCVPVAVLLTASIEESSGWSVVAVLLAGLGFAVGGAVAGRRQPATPAVHGALAAGVAVGILVVIRIVRRLLADEDIVWGSIAVSVILAVWLGVGGAVVSARRVWSRQAADRSLHEST
jgi:putative membrane protein (TIGR04086 family)